MATVMPQNELVRRALNYLFQQRRERPEASLASLLDEAGMRFNLTPLEAAELENIFYDANGSIC